jgi:predicted secreted protein
MKEHSMTLGRLAAVALLVGTLTASVLAAPPEQRREGTVVLMAGTAEVDVANDEAVAQFYLEVQDADLQKAQSQVNQRVAEGVAQLKRADPKAQIETTGYGSYPVYQPGTQRKLVGWRVRQSVSLRTSELATLPRTVQAGQQVLALGGIDFRLARATRAKIEAELIEQAIENVNAKVQRAARALNVPPDRVRLEELNFGVAPAPVPIAPRMRMEAMAAASPVEEPQFDAGRTLQQLTVTARARLLPPL